MVMILAEVYLIIAVLFLAGKDASSYLLKNKADNSLSNTRVKRWHRDGVILNLLFIIPLLLLVNPFLITIYAVLIRLSIFDISFNYWAQLDPKYLGSTSKFDQLFAKYLGQEGAIKKSLIFLGVLILLNVIF